MGESGELELETTDGRAKGRPRELAIPREHISIAASVSEGSDRGELGGDPVFGVTRDGRGGLPKSVGAPPVDVLHPGGELGAAVSFPGDVIT